VRDLDVPQPKGTTTTLQMIHAFALASALQIAADSALHLGDAREAEGLARRRAGMLSESMTAAQDPRIEAMRARTILAHSLVLQGRRAEAGTELDPALKYYESVERAARARNLTFVRDYARALAVRSMASSGDGDGRAEADASLAKATTLLNSLPPETRALSDVRDVTATIAAARR